MRNFLVAICVLSFTLVVHSCGGGGDPTVNTDFVETGTYEVTLNEVDARDRAVFVETSEGKMLGLKFTEKTQLMQSDQTVDFKALRPGQTLEIRLINRERYLEPVEIKIVG